MIAAAIPVTKTELKAGEQAGGLANGTICMAKPLCRFADGSAVAMKRAAAGAAGA